MAITGRISVDLDSSGSVLVRTVNGQIEVYRLPKSVETESDVKELMSRLDWADAQLAPTFEISVRGPRGRRPGTTKPTDGSPQPAAPASSTGEPASPATSARQAPKAAKA